MNQEDHEGNTPPIRAVMNGNEAVVTILLGYGEIDTDKPDRRGATALWWAAETEPK